LEEKKKQINSFLYNVKYINNIVSKLGTGLDDNQLIKTLCNKREQTNELEKIISKQLEENKDKETEEEDIKLIQKFKRYQEYWKNQLYKFSLKKEKEIIDSNKAALQQEQSQEEQDNFDSKLKKVGVETKYQNKEEVLNAYIQERNTKVKELKKDMQDVGQIFQVTTKLLADQHQQLDTIENKTIESEVQTEDSLKILAKSAKKQTTSTYFGSIAFGAALGAVCGSPLGPVGTIFMASAGGSLGSVFSSQIDKIQNSTVDKELFEHEMKKKWMPDSSVVGCQACQVVFTYVIRRHHCRSCGRIFCNDCSSNKLLMKLPNMDTERNERVCNKCFNKFWS